jgi:2-hydroxy-6-oxonona-2,4-dienedioate hydrolase
MTERRAAVIKQYPMGAVVPMTGSDVIETRILEAGEGGDVIVCVHGVGSRADRFRPTLGPLAAAGYHVYALDLPGHGFATKGALPLSVPYYAHYVGALIDQLPADRVTLLGTSLGGQIGGYLLTLDGARIDRLVMIGTLGIVPLPKEVRVDISRVILRNRSVDDCIGKLKALLWDDDLVSRSWAEEESLINNSHGADETFRQLGDYFEHAINDDLVRDAVLEHRNDVELGLMWGDRDVIVSVETGRQCIDALPGVPMAWIRDTGHAPYYERPDDFITAMEMLFDESRRESLVYSV